MSHWKWDSSFSIGIEVIDNQNKQIVECINNLNIAFSYNKQYMVEEVLKNLIKYTESHFSLEEKLIQEAGFEMLEVHKQSHKAFTERIKFFKERYENGEDIAKQLKTELQLWLINHIQKDDADYKEIVQNMLRTKDIAPVKKPSNNSWIKALIKNMRAILIYKI